MVEWGWGRGWEGFSLKGGQLCELLRAEGQIYVLTSNITSQNQRISGAYWCLNEILYKEIKKQNIIIIKIIKLKNKIKKIKLKCKNQDKLKDKKEYLKDHKEIMSEESD